MCYVMIITVISDVSNLQMEIMAGNGLMGYKTIRSMFQILYVLKCLVSYYNCDKLIIQNHSFTSGQFQYSERTIEVGSKHSIKNWGGGVKTQT